MTAKLSNKAIATALRETGGVELAAARLVSRRLGRTVTREEIIERIKASPALQQVVEDAEEETLDLAEKHLHDAIRKGKGTEIRFFLSTSGASRYDRQSGTDSVSEKAKALQDRIANMTQKEREEARARALKRVEEHLRSKEKGAQKD